MEPLSKIIKTDLPEKKTKGASYEWQDRAARYAQRLGIKPSPSWFRLFKYANPGLIEAAASVVLDSNVENRERYFYKIYYNKSKGIKPSWVV